MTGTTMWSPLGEHSFRPLTGDVRSWAAGRLGGAAHTALAAVMSSAHPIVHSVALQGLRCRV